MTFHNQNQWLVQIYHAQQTISKQHHKTPARSQANRIISLAWSQQMKQETSNEQLRAFVAQSSPTQPLENKTTAPIQKTQARYYPS